MEADEIREAYATGLANHEHACGYLPVLAGWVATIMLEILA